VIATQTSQEVELALVELAQQGDRNAFGELVSRHREGVINVAYRMSGNVQMAEDIAQEAFIKAWQKLPSYRPQAPFRNWVYRIATNATLDLLRKEKDTVDLDAIQIASPIPHVEDQVADTQRAGQVRQAVLALPEASRSVLALREYEGLSYQEIADTLDIPLGTVMSRLNYARKAMRDSLSHLLEDS
jgi:RNA polymerase sigma-70 factor (ECF subfamily)